MVGSGISLLLEIGTLGEPSVAILANLRSILYSPQGQHRACAINRVWVNDHLAPKAALTAVLATQIF